jgi:hypothetical protein
LSFLFFRGKLKGDGNRKVLGGEKEKNEKNENGILSRNSTCDICSAYIGGSSGRKCFLL